MKLTVNKIEDLEDGTARVIFDGDYETWNTLCKLAEKLYDEGTLTKKVCNEYGKGYVYETTEWKVAGLLGLALNDYAYRNEGFIKRLLRKLRCVLKI